MSYTRAGSLDDLESGGLGLSQLKTQNPRLNELLFSCGVWGPPDTGDPSEVKNIPRGTEEILTFSAPAKRVLSPAGA